jgi:hypothetical protein
VSKVMELRYWAPPTPPTGVLFAVIIIIILLS